MINFKNFISLICNESNSSLIGHTFLDAFDWKSISANLRIENFRTISCKCCLNCYLKIFQAEYINISNEKSLKKILFCLKFW